MKRATPMQTKLVLYPKVDTELTTTKPYRGVIGSLMHLMIWTRPDIAFIVQNLGRHLQKSNDEHIKACKRVFRYLKATVGLHTIYGLDASLGPVFVGFCDADFGGDLSTRRSTTAYVFMLGGGATTWASKLQATVALSSAESEYVAVSAAVQDAIYLRWLFADLGFLQRKPTVIYEDNQGCIALTENPVNHKRTKHIDIRHHFVRERVESGDVALKYVATKDQVADLLTKPLKRVDLERLRSVIVGRNKL